MTELLCYTQKISAPCESRRTSIFTSYTFYLYFSIWLTLSAQQWPADGGPPVASRWWADGGQPMVRRRRQAKEMCHRLAISSPTVDRWWQFAAYSHWRTDGVVLSGTLQREGILVQNIQKLTDQPTLERQSTPGTVYGLKECQTRRRARHSPRHDMSYSKKRIRRQKYEEMMMIFLQGRGPPEPGASEGPYLESDESHD